MDFFKGWNLPPWFVGFVRAVLLAIAYAAINAAILFFSETTIEGLAIYQPFIILFLRQLEGLLDQVAKPAANDRPPAVEEHR